MIKKMKHSCSLLMEVYGGGVCVLQSSKMIDDGDVTMGSWQ